MRKCFGTLLDQFGRIEKWCIMPQTSKQFEHVDLKGYRSHLMVTRPALIMFYFVSWALIFQYGSMVQVILMINSP